MLSFDYGVIDQSFFSQECTLFSALFSAFIHKFSMLTKYRFWSYSESDFHFPHTMGGGTPHPISPTNELITFLPRSDQLIINASGQQYTQDFFSYCACSRFCHSQTRTLMRRSQNHTILVRSSWSCNKQMGSGNKSELPPWLWNGRPPMWYCISWYAIFSPGGK